MRIIILSVNHIYANKIVKDLIKEFKKKIVLIVEPKGLLPKKSLFASLKIYLHISGFEYVFYQSVRVLLFRIIGKFYTFIFPKNIDGKFYLKEKLAKINKIDIIKVSDVNNESVSEKLIKKRPDLIVSVFFNQILDEKIIGIPKKGSINVHPGFLPKYRGISPIFWSLLNEEKFIWVSIHTIDRGIDSGPILKRIKIYVEKADSEDSLYWKCAIVGSKALIDVIKRIKKGKLKTIKNKGGKFYSFPTKDSIKKFREYKRSFLNLRDYLFSD